MVSGEAIAWWTYLGFVWLIATPFVVHCMYRFYLYRHHVAINNRVWRATISSLCGILLSLAIHNPLSVFLFDVGYIDSPALKFVSILVFDIALHTVIAAPCYRVWRLYYQVQMSLSLEEKKWKNIIKQSGTDDNWFVKHLSTYGNGKWCAIRVSVAVALIIAGRLCIALFVSPNNYADAIAGRLYDFVATFPAQIIALYLFCTLSKTNDVHFIRYELKVVWYLVLAVDIAMPIGVLLRVNLRQPWYADLVRKCFWTVFVLAFASVQTHLVLRKCQLSGKEPIKLSVGAYLARQSTLREENSPQTTDTMRKYFTVWRSADLFHLFCAHVTEQWSVESLVGFIEFAQLFSALMLRCPKDIALELSMLNGYKFARIKQAMPHSDIVFDHRSYPTLSQKLNALYVKYIAVGARLQLNLSGSFRSQWLNAISESKQQHPEQIIMEMMWHNENSFVKRQSVIDAEAENIATAIDFVREMTAAVSATTSSDELSFDTVDIDVDLAIFLPLIHRVLEQCHLLLMDSFSRFKYERIRGSLNH